MLLNRAVVAMAQQLVAWTIYEASISGKLQVPLWLALPMASKAAQAELTDAFQRGVTL